MFQILLFILRVRLKNLNAGRICAIIGLILNILSLLYYAAIIIIFGFGMMNDPQKVQEILKGLQ